MDWYNEFIDINRLVRDITLRIFQEMRMISVFCLESNKRFPEHKGLHDRKLKQKNRVKSFFSDTVYIAFGTQPLPNWQMGNWGSSFGHKYSLETVFFGHTTVSLCFQEVQSKIYHQVVILKEIWMFRGCLMETNLKLISAAP